MSDDLPPLWFLDVDGVVNAISAQPDPAVWSDWSTGRATVDGRPWTIRFSPTVTSTVARLHTEGLAEVCWLTTWGHAVNDDLRVVLGLPELPVAGTFEDESGDGPVPEEDPADGSVDQPVDQATEQPESHARLGGRATAVDPLTGVWWKLDVVRLIHAVDPARRIVWTDDDLRLYPEALEWFRANARGLCLAPDEKVGLTREHLAAVRDYLDDPTL
ncbi:HAD domain-containing protein [Kineosporia sp. A_224]|uniref:HAD domain-containing protein n=1 Tax=Kineosporia sp. A_224 TaxID=1962180 RepID=UPI001179D67C|nr:HAD domain-containing protein [Kineosporia sp. A_224]